jgi:hypothetical protein
VLHSPSNHGTKNDLIQRFNHSTLHHAGQPPDEWFSELDIYRTELLIQYKHDITERMRPLITSSTKLRLAMVKREMNDPKYVQNLNNP